MNTHEILKSIKALFAENPEMEKVKEVAPIEPVMLEAKEYSLADGTKVMIDRLEVGGLVTLNDLPAPVGEHILADGSKVELDENGIIVEIEAAEPAAPVVEEEVLAAPAIFKDPRVDALEAELNKVKLGFSKLVSLVESLTKESAAEPIEMQKTEFGAIAESRKERLAKITNVLTNIKNK